MSVLGEVGGAIARGYKDTVKAGKKASGDLAKATKKAIEDFKKETKRTEKNVSEAAVAIGTFLEHQAQVPGKTLSDAQRRIQEGKLIDAVWLLATDHLKHTEDNLAEAVMESSLLNTVASSAVGIYGGPGGAAAYAAWYTYKMTNDLTLALKAGALAGATSEGLDLVKVMPTGTQKVLATASIGGAAVAASGGDEREIIEAFVKGGALTSAREHYQKTTTKEIEGKAPTQSALAKDDPKIRHQFKVLVDKKGTPILDWEGREQIDIRSMPREVSHVGLQTGNANIEFISTKETSVLMQTIAKLPYVNDMAYFHDQWAAVAQMHGIEVQATILPAFALVIIGSKDPLIQQVIQENVSSSKSGGGGKPSKAGDGGKPSKAGDGGKPSKPGSGGKPSKPGSGGGQSTPRDAGKRYPVKTPNDLHPDI